jgi:hypothetical protein
MSRADDLRAQFESDLAIAELEDELIRLKEARNLSPDAEDDPELRRVKNELVAVRAAAFEAAQAAAQSAEEGAE